MCGPVTRGHTRCAVTTLPRRRRAPSWVLVRVAKGGMLPRSQWRVRQVLPCAVAGRRVTCADSDRYYPPVALVYGGLSTICDRRLLELLNLLSIIACTLRQAMVRRRFICVV